MEITRRDFIKYSLILGGMLYLPNGAPHAAQNRKTDGYPAYGKLEKSGKLAERIARAVGGRVRTLEDGSLRIDTKSPPDEEEDF